jgi:hypothetical protein
MKKLSLWVKSLLVVSLIAPQISLAQTKPAPEQQQQIPQLLFVQNAASVVTDKSGRVLTLQGLSPTTLYFSDRPVRLAGHYRTAEYMKFWKEGPDSFLKDPPNATLSMFQKGNDDLLDVVVTLRNPRLKANDLSYDVTVISGKLPKAGGPATLFIDIIGMPWTPFSFAGMARRAAYRTVLYDSAATSAAAAAAASAYYRPPVYVATPPCAADGHCNTARSSSRSSHPDLGRSAAKGTEVSPKPGTHHSESVSGRIAKDSQSAIRVGKIRRGQEDPDQVPPKSAKGRISLGLRRICPKPCGGFRFQVSEMKWSAKPQRTM